MKALLTRLKAVLFARRLDRDLDDEVGFHLDMMTAEYVRRGMSDEDARREARRNFGGVTQVKEEYRERRGLPFLDTLTQDARYAVRTLRRSPGFTAAALITLALGIGANTAIFSVVHAVLLRPLPYAESDRLVTFGDRIGADLNNIDFTTMKDYRDQAKTFDYIMAMRLWVPTLVANGEAERIAAVRVNWNYFEMLGVQPALGRGFRADEDRPDHWRVLLISDALWRRRFNADPAVVGRAIRMNDRDYQVIGVLPASFEPLISAHFYTRADIWAPLGYDTAMRDACRGCQHLHALGRIREGISLGEAAAELNTIRKRIVAQFPNKYPRADVAVVPLQEVIAGPVRGALLTLLVAVGFILLIACANVANLLLARGMSRSREMAIRGALGAGRGRLVRQLLTECLVVGMTGGALGVGLAAILLGGLPAIAPLSIPRLDDVSLDVTVLGFAAAVSVVTALLFGVLPAWRVAAADPQRALTLDSRTSAGPGSPRARRVLVVADLAIALLLIAGAGLMLKSVARLLAVDPGFDPRGVLTAQFSLVGTAYAEDAPVVQFTDRLVERAAALPGVEAAATAGQIPMGGNGDQWGFHVEHRVVANAADNPMVERYSVTPDYFRVMRIPLLKGRAFTAADREGAVPVMIVSEATAKSVWPNQNPIGQRVRIGGPDSGPWRTVIGIAGDVRHFSLDAAPTLQMYLPQAQLADSFLVLTVRTGGDPAALLPSVRQILRDLDPAVPVYDVATLADRVARTAAQRRFVMQLLVGFAGLALLLASVGLYGVVSYTVAQRTREVGVRVALGASPADIMRLILGSGMGTVATGVAAGLAATLLAGRYLGTLLFAVKPYDAITIAASCALLVLVAAVAHWLPARRALRIDPTRALRQE
jgi:putative ABC transport system permease protein